MLESEKHSVNSFITLTYDESHLPEGGSLVKKHYQNWLKNLRGRFGSPIRYFLVGEYGGESFRPHYHAALFGYPSCWWWPGSDRASLFQRSKCKCDPCSMLRASWDKGKTDCGELNKDSAQYIAGYVTKKLTTPDDDNNREFRAQKGLLLYDRVPEFARMSLKPGIGALAVDDICDVLTSKSGVNCLVGNKDIPVVLMHGKKMLPLGRYLRSKCREKIASKNGQEIIKKEGQKRYAEKMYSMLRDGQSTSGYRSLRQILSEDLRQKILSREYKFKLFSSKGKL